MSAGVTPWMRVAWPRVWGADVGEFELGFAFDAFDGGVVEGGGFHARGVEKTIPHGIQCVGGVALAG